ncbi:MAG: hemolysin secretion protein [Hyphomicrobiales bacterium]|nr:hemolysin secretion protein [Hyphomicrobiales bacterium]
MPDISTRDPGAEHGVDAAKVHRLPTKSAQALQETQEAPEQAAALEGEPEEKPGRRWVRPLLFVLLPIALATGGYYYVEGGQIMSTENAYVRADLVGVSTDISGIVREVEVKENQKVATGDILFRLDDLPFRLALTRANAQIGIVAAQLNALKTSYRDMQAQVQQAQVDVEFYGRELARQNELLKRSVATEASLEQAQRNAQSAQQKVASLNQQLAGIAANLAGDPNIDIEKHPRYIDAVAARDEAARQLAHTTVRAPMSGTVTNVPSLQPGQFLAASTSAMSVVATDHMWIEANPKETELTYIKPGQDVAVTVDTYPDQEWHGTVDSVSPASSSSFALLPAQNTSGNWVKVVQRIPMRVRLDTPEGKPPLRAGMSVVIDVNTGHKRGLPTFLTGLFGAGAHHDV